LVVSFASSHQQKGHDSFAPTERQRLATAHESREAAHPDRRILRRKAPQIALWRLAPVVYVCRVALRFLNIPVQGRHNSNGSGWILSKD
jgi:hypothetical protein